jgi:hypothetical protein
MSQIHKSHNADQLLNPQVCKRTVPFYLHSCWRLIPLFPKDHSRRLKQHNSTYRPQQANKVWFFSYLKIKTVQSLLIYVIKSYSFEQSKSFTDYCYHWWEWVMHSNLSTASAPTNSCRKLSVPWQKRQNIILLISVSVRLFRQLILIHIIHWMDWCLRHIGQSELCRTQ